MTKHADAWRLSRRRLRRLAGFYLALAVMMPSSAPAQSNVDEAIRFYTAGGSYCFRIAPSGVVMSQELEWTVMVLTSASNQNSTFKIRDVDPGRTGLRGADLVAAGMTVNGVWRFDGERADFFERFAAGIDAGILRARIVKTGPANLAQLKSDRERADAYLKFADRGSRISFDKVPDLTAEQFREYADYFPD
jgi:hypothetical protein